jgi:hypothetical protein
MLIVWGSFAAENYVFVKRVVDSQGLVKYASFPRKVATVPLAKKASLHEIEI